MQIKKQLKLAPIKSNPTNTIKSIHETEASNKHNLSVLFHLAQDVYLKARDVSNGLWESLKDLKRNSCLARLSPSIKAVKAFDNHIKSISCGSQVTSILPLQVT